MATPPPALHEGRARPDPALGLLETILVRDGDPQCLEDHLARLRRSMDVLYGMPLDPGLRERLVVTAAAQRDGALRVRASDEGRFEVTVEPPRGREIPVRLRPVTLPGGLGAHKWADRRLLDALAAQGATPLLVDGDGSVLEAGWGNIWIAEGDFVVTPPADGRLLPGVRRGAMLRRGIEGRLRTREESITLERVIDADAVLVSASLAGVVPASL
jgi:para-aminobenzoate synthetase/4-amino-4-deoxychorismate lyase